MLQSGVSNVARVRNRNYNSARWIGKTMVARNRRESSCSSMTQAVALVRGELLDKVCECGVCCIISCQLGSIDAVR